MKYTKEELRKFDRLTLDLSSKHQMTRIRARLDIQVFEKQHGEQKCRAMFEVLKERDARKK